MTNNSNTSSQAQAVGTFGLGMAIILVISNIIGSGVFKKVVPMTEYLGSPQMVLLGWVLAGLITIFGVLSAAEAASMFPDNGGPYSWLGKMYGRAMGFTYGWACFTVIQGATIASIAVVFAQALDSFIPLFHLSPEWESWVLLETPTDTIKPFNNFGANLVAVALIWVLTAINIRGTKFGGSISGVVTGAIIVGILCIILISFFGGTGSMSNLSSSAGRTPAAFATWGGMLMSYVLAMRAAFWAYEGWISLGYIGQEIKDPQKNLPLALIFGIMAVIGIYVLVNFAYLYAMPIDDLMHQAGGKDVQMAWFGLDEAAAQQQADANSGNIAAVLVLNNILGPIGAGLISGLILISTFGCTNTTILGASRIYNAMAINGEFFKSAAEIHPQYGTPHKSLLMQAVWASILAMSGSFDFLTNLLVFAAFIFYGLISAGIVILRYKMPNAERPYKTFGYPFVPIFFSAFCVVLVGLAFWESWQNALLGTALILSGLPFYFNWTKAK